MPVFQLGKEMFFPPSNYADEDGLLAFGGDLSLERLILAYKNGIFPWYSEGEPILWWSPDPRFVLVPSELRISRSMKKLLKKNRYKITFDTNFSKVMNLCGETRKRTGTWITDDMLNAYINLHKKGYAHSVEVWNEKDDLVGGLYGVSLGKVFYGESMFSLESNTSKMALIKLSEKLINENFELIDCQVYTEHLESLGAKMLSKDFFMKILSNQKNNESLIGNWSFFNE